MSEPLLTRYLPPLLAGRRAECFRVIQEAIAGGVPAERLLSSVVWPAIEQVGRLYRDDQINAALENMASRINRTIAGQLQAHLPTGARNGRRVLIACADVTPEETGAQIVADLFQAEGWEAYFLGGGVPHDEILKLAGELRPSLLLLFGTQPSAVPEVRRLIDVIREIDVCPTMNIMVSGGVFNRADGLWQEIGADAYAETAPSIVRRAAELRPRQPGAPRPAGIVKKRRRKRKGAIAGPSALHAAKATPRAMLHSA